METAAELVGLRERIYIGVAELQTEALGCSGVDPDGRRVLAGPCRAEQDRGEE